MSAAIDPVLQRTLAGLAPGISVGQRLIAPGDKFALLDGAARSIAATVPGGKAVMRSDPMLDLRLCRMTHVVVPAFRRAAGGTRSPRRDAS